MGSDSRRQAFHSRLNLMRLREGRQVADGPRDHVAIAMQVAIAFGVRAQYFRDVARDRGLLGQDGDGGGTQITSVPNARPVGRLGTTELQ